jgi:uncharacterized protein (DUF983 family)
MRVCPYCDLGYVWNPALPQTPARACRRCGTQLSALDQYGAWRQVRRWLRHTGMRFV